MDARKVQPDSDGAVPFVQTSIDFEHLFPHMPLPHLDNIIHSSHFDNAKNLQGHCSSDGAVFRSFQQLLMDASSGVLCSSFSNAALSPLGAFATIQNGSHTHMTFDTPEEFTQQDVPDDGYSAGTESEHDTVSPNHSLERIDEDNNIHISNSENDDYVAIFSDSIGQDDFMSGRDFDYGDFAVGIDDTDLNASDLENVSFGKDDVDICPGPNFSDLCTEDNVATADHSVAPAEKINMSNDKEIHVSLLGDCGCSDHAIAHEISSLYQDGVSRGFFKRQRLGSNPKSVDCRKPRDMGALEVAMRTAGQRQTTEVFEPTLGMVFDSYEEGYEFYNLYSWEAGFGIIYNRNATRKNDKDYRTMQEFCC